MAEEYFHGHTQSGWARIAATTLAQTIRNVEDCTLRDYAFLALLQSQGRVIFNDSGNGIEWPVKFRLPNVMGYSGENALTFNRKNIHKLAVLAWRGYYATESMTYKEYKINQTPHAVVKTFANMVKELTTAIEQRLPVEAFVNGDAPGNEERWQGLETLFAIDGTLNSTTGEQRAANVADKVGYPSGSYAGISTELGFYGGQMRTDAGGVTPVWPDGIADPEFDFWSPMVFNYLSTAFGGQNHTWADQGKEVLSYAIVHAQRNKSQSEQTTQLYLARDLWVDFTESMRQKERIAVTSGTGLRSLGFTNVVEWDGMECTWDSAVPSGQGYGVPLGKCELRSMESSLLKPEGPDWDFRSQTFDAAVTSLSNLKFESPRNFWKLAPVKGS